MARRDVVNYYISVQNQYFEMLDDIKDFDEALKLGKFTQEQYEQALTLVEKVRDNYNMWSYMILLLNEPSKKKKKANFKRQNAKVYDYLANSGSCYIKEENEDVLKKLKELINKEESNG